MWHIASVSFGKDSLAMLLRLLEESAPLDEVVFYDTGMEFQAIYDTRDAILPMLNRAGIKYTELHPDNPFLYDMLHRPVKGRATTGYGWCGGLCRWGTTKKTQTIENHIKQYTGGVIEYVGIAFDETNRIKSKEYPLIKWEMTEASCLQYCYDRGFQWQEDGGAGLVRLYDVLDRVSCWCCCNKNLKELKNIYLYLPDYWQKLKYLQFCQSRPMKGFYKGEPRGIYELEKRFAAEITKEAEI